MNRRTFVQHLGAGAVGLAALESQVGAQVPAGTTPAPAGGPIRIGSNENPYGPAPSAIEAVRSTCLGANRYPGPTVQQLVAAVARKHGVGDDHVLLSGGSGDILRAVVLAHTSPTRALVTGSPSYESPVRTTAATGAPVTAVPLTGDLRLDLPAMAAAAQGAGVLYLCNPNNPTGTAVPAGAVTSAIEAVVAASPGTCILVDEAYFEYADLSGFATATPLVAAHPNVVIARTFSKIHGMAGMRVGYAIGQPTMLGKLRAFHSSSGMSVMSVAAATASLTDTVNLEKNIAMNREVRATTVAAFEKAGYRVAPSDANFLFVEVKRDAREFQDACRTQGVLVGRTFPPLTSWARISIGTREEMTKAIPVFMRVLESAPRQSAALDHQSLDALPNELT